jgi:hypothetical protein
MNRASGPEVLVLRSSKWLWLGVAIICALFTVGALWGLASTGDALWLLGPAAIFFGGGMLVALVGLLRGAGELRLDQDGFSATALFMRRRYRWHDVLAPFKVVPIAGAPEGRRRNPS